MADEPAGARDALRPLRSLIAKSAKAQARLAPGTWQHAMLRDNLRALRLAVAVLRGGPGAARSTRQGREAALAAIASMAGKAAAARARFPAGSPHHTLQSNRLKALRAAQRALRAAGRTRARTPGPRP